jgi:hypothetical protein
MAGPDTLKEPVFIVAAISVPEIIQKYEDDIGLLLHSFG